MPRRAGWIAGVAVVLVLGLFLLTRGDGQRQRELTPAERARMEQSEIECAVVASEQLDRRRYRVGGREWAELAKDCAVRKATERAP